MDKANPEGSRSKISCPLIIITVIPCWNIPTSIPIRCRDQETEGCRRGHLPSAVGSIPSHRTATPRCPHQGWRYAAANATRVAPARFSAPCFPIQV
ncbi:unnamed protein product [Musa textilis]